MLRLLIIFMLTLGAAGVAWRHSHDAEPDGPAYRTATVTRGDVVVLVSATGTINPVTSVQVGSQISGIIAKMYADFNTKVTNGMLLAEIDPSTFQATVQQARANLEKARAAELTATANLAKSKANVETAKADLIVAQANADKARAEVVVQERTLARQTPLVKEKLVAPGDLDKTQALRDEAVAAAAAATAQIATARAKVSAAEADIGSSEAAISSAKSDVKQRQAELDIAEINLSRTKIYSPVDGVVVSRAVDVGQTVAASLSAPTTFVIAKDLTQMQINTSIDEADIGKIKEGQEVRFTVDAYTDRSFVGKVKQVRLGPVVNSNVVTYDCVVSVDNPDLKLLPGMTASASVLVSRADEVLRVPAAALSFKPEADEDREKGEGGERGGGGGRGGRVGGAGKARGKDRSRLFARGKAERPPHVYVLGEGEKLIEVRVKTGLSDGRFVEVMDPGAELARGRTGAGLEGMRHRPDGEGRRHRGEGGWRKRRDGEAAGASPATSPAAPVSPDSDEPTLGTFAQLKEGAAVVIGREVQDKNKSALGGGNPFQSGGHGPRIR